MEVKWNGSESSNLKKSLQLMQEIGWEQNIMSQGRMDIQAAIDLNEHRARYSLKLIEVLLLL